MLKSVNGGMKKSSMPLLMIARVLHYIMIGIDCHLKVNCILMLVIVYTCQFLMYT